LSGALTLVVLALVLFPQPVAPPPVPGAAPLSAHETLELLTDDQDPQFYQDLELYLWLEREDVDA
jgi:hypothetical protein